MLIALLGAECTGKTQLSQTLVRALSVDQAKAFSVPEVLREWCDRNGRTPQRHEQVFIAHAQASAQATVQVQAGRQVQDPVTKSRPNSPRIFVVADTTALMTAVYSDLLFQDTSLYPFGVAQQRQFDLTLVMGLDLPWVADGVQRDGPQQRTQVDARLRQVLDSSALPYTMVYGLGERRTACALQAITQHCGSVQNNPPTQPSQWRWNCEKCSDANCEHQLFSALMRPKAF